MINGGQIINPPVTKILIVDDERDLVEMLTCTLRKRGYEILVKDNGIGILSEDLPKIFEPFERGRNTSGKKGIGLSLVKEVVDLHGGKILVQSEPQKGRTFSILLPAKNSCRKKGGENAVENLTIN